MTDRSGISWAGRHVLVVGLARSGQAAARLLQRAGALPRVTEMRRTEGTAYLAEQLREDGIERVELGGHSRELYTGCELVVVSPGVPESSEPLQWARAQGIPILSEIELAYRFCASKIIAVTGTNGKSTVVTLIYRLLQAAGRKAVACGNLGTPFSSHIPELSPDATVVVEVSSFQLLDCHTFRPSIAVLLNLGTNHLDRHPDHQSYVEAKARLFQAQTEDDYAVMNHADPQVAALNDRLAARCIWFGDSEGSNPPGFALDPATCRALPENVQAVLQVSRLLGIPDPMAWQVIREFRGLEHRMEYVTTVRGVRIVNDAKSTTPESCRYALSRCVGPVVVIVGGKDKGLDFEMLRPALLEDRVRAVMLIGESRPVLRQVLGGHAKIRECEALDEALQASMAAAQPGDTILFSPACASFDMFKNFEDRGRAFKQLARALSEGESRSGGG